MIEHRFNRDSFAAFQGTLPYLPNAPAFCEELRLCCGVHSFVAFDLFPPKIHAGAGPLEQVAVVSVPEAAMYEDHRTVARQHKIRFPR